MPDNFETALVAAGAVIIGAALTAAAASYSARQKIREITLANEHKLRADYLSNARLYTQTLYVPLSIAVSRLSLAYRTFRNKVDLENGTAPEEAESLFRDACRAYLDSMRESFERGSSAFLTTELEERFLSFNAFLEESLASTTSLTKLVVEYGVDLRFLPFGGSTFQFSRNIQLPTRHSRLFPRGTISAGLGILGLQYKGSEVLAAPIASRDFEQRALGDMTGLKALIKEVTLGARIAK